MRRRGSAGRRWSGALCALLVLAGCGETPAESLRLRPDDLVGSWALSASGRCREFGWITRLQVERAEATAYDRINLTGRWESNRPTEPPVPSRSTFSGNADALTGDFEVILWKAGYQEGVITGTIGPDGVAIGTQSWGACPDMAGARTSR